MIIENAKWYLVQVVSNYEIKVKEQLQNRQFAEGEEGIKEIYLPTTTVVTKTGRTRKKSLFPGYIFVKVEMTDDAWFIIRNTQYVTGIVGSSGQRAKPTPIPQTQIDTMVEKALVEQAKHDSKAVDPSMVGFKKGDLVDVLTGNFAGNIGKVIDIDYSNAKVTVEIEFLGRKSEVPLSINEVKVK